MASASVSVLASSSSIVRSMTLSVEGAAGVKGLGVVAVADADADADATGSVLPVVAAIGLVGGSGAMFTTTVTCSSFFILLGSRLACK